MWNYYGCKANIVDYYPTPKHDRIIEPFAGSARYSLKWFEKEVLLIDKYSVVVKLWKWLQKCSKNDIKRLPRFIDPQKKITSLNLDCVEAESLMVFLCSYGAERPRKTSSQETITIRPNDINCSLNRIANNLFKIRHWKIKHGDYSKIRNKEATWFIDAPYQYGGERYVHGSKKIDFKHLSGWIKKRQGQIIVCENTKANWMEFKPFVNYQTSKKMQSEAIWCNHRTAFDNRQLSIF